MISHDYNCPAPWSKIISVTPQEGELVWFGGLALTHEQCKLNPEKASLTFTLWVLKGAWIKGVIQLMPLAEESVGDHLRMEMWCPVTNQGEPEPEHPWTDSDVDNYLKAVLPVSYPGLTPIPLADE